MIVHPIAHMAIATFVCAGALLLPASAKVDRAEIDLETYVPYEEAQTIFQAKKASTNYPSVRIPSIIHANGVTIAAAEGRKRATDQGSNDIIISLSKDNGRSWSKPFVAASDPKNGTFNNPYLIFDSEKKRFILFFQYYPAGISEHSSMMPGWKDPKTVRNMVCFSDNGKRWSKPKDVTSTTKHEDVTLTCSGPNPGVQLTRGKHRGRLVVVFNEAAKFGDWVLTAAYSDDHGKTWKLGKKSESGKGINEVSVAETDDGGLYVVSRTWGGGAGRRVSYSHDGGETWEPIVGDPNLPSPNCQNGMVRYSHADDAARGNKSRIIFSSPTRNNRSNGVIKMSYDNGKTWPVEKSFGEGKYAYSAICPLEPGFFGVLFESDGGQTIRFARIPMAWLTDGEDSGAGKKPESVKEETSKS